MQTQLSITGGLTPNVVTRSPRGAIIYVSSVLGLDSRRRLSFPGAPATSTGGSTQGPIGDPTKPMATVFGTNGALSACVADRGDIIVVDILHTENLSTNGAYSIPAGVTIVGVGGRTERPSFTFTGGANTTITMGQGSRIINCHFALDGVASVAKGFNMIGSGSQLQMVRIMQAGATNQAANAVTIAAADCVLDDVEIDATAAAGAVTGVITGAAVARMRLLNCKIIGDFSGAPVKSASTNHATFLVMDNCILWQLNAAKIVFDLTTSSTGIIRNNTFLGTGWATAADAYANSTSTNLRFTQNYGFDNVGTVNGVLIPAVGTLS